MLVKENMELKHLYFFFFGRTEMSAFLLIIPSFYFYTSLPELSH